MKRGDRTQARPEMLAGTRAVLEALRAGRRPLLRLRIRSGRRGRALQEILDLAGRLGVPVETAEPDSLRRGLPADLRDQGVVLEAGPLPETPLDVLAGGSADPCWLVALDGVEDPQNVGAVIRVAEGAGVSGLVLERRRAPPLSGALARASAGAAEHLPITRVPNLPRALNLLKEQEFWIVGSEVEEAGNLFALEDRLLTGKLVFVFGAEGRGLRPAVQAVLDHRIRIPMRGRVDSLNVSTAAAVVLFETLRRSEKDPHT